MLLRETEKAHFFKELYTSWYYELFLLGFFEIFPSERDIFISPNTRGVVIKNTAAKEP